MTSADNGHNEDNDNEDEYYDSNKDDDEDDNEDEDEDHGSTQRDEEKGPQVVTVCLFFCFHRVHHSLPCSKSKREGVFFVFVCTQVHLASHYSRGGLVIIYYYIAVVFFCSSYMYHQKAPA